MLNNFATCYEDGWILPQSVTYTLEEDFDSIVVMHYDESSFYEPAMKPATQQDIEDWIRRKIRASSKCIGFGELYSLSRIACQEERRRDRMTCFKHAYMEPEIPKYIYCLCSACSGGFASNQDLSILNNHCASCMCQACVCPLRRRLKMYRQSIVKPCKTTCPSIKYPKDKKCIICHSI